MQTNKMATISLGKPVTSPVLVPVKHMHTPACINNPFMVDGECFKVTAMSFGKPHGAVIVKDINSVDVEGIGSKLGTHVLFPKGAFIVFIQILDKENIAVRLWSPEEGEITFTPEAACVAGTAVMMLQKVLGYNVNVIMGENTFDVQWDRGKGNVSLTGPAELVESCQPQLV